jgi:phosphate-selective porin OprO/OprP
MKPFLYAGCALVALSASPAVAQGLNPAEMQAKIEAQDARIRDLEAKLDRLLAAPPPVEQIPAQTASPAKAPVEEITAKVRGRFQVDALALNSGDGATPTGTQIRRFYLGAEGKVAGGFRYQAEADFAGNKVALQDMLLAYQANPQTELVVGYFKPQITQDDMTSDVYTLFLERSAYAGVFAPGRRVGAGVNYAGSRFGVRAGVFGEREDATLDVNRTEGWVASLRAHGDLLPGDDVLHVALSTYYTASSDTDHAINFSQKPETNRALSAIATGDFHADHGIFYGGELGWSHGPFLAQAEGGVLRFNGAGGPSPDFSGWSAQVSWRPTGEVRPYDVKTGVFGRVVPKTPLSAGGAGAFELGLRMTHVDLNDNGLAGGELTTYGGVVNWYPVTRIRLSANLIHSQTERPTLADINQTALTLRGAIDW